MSSTRNRERIIFHPFGTGTFGQYLEKRYKAPAGWFDRLITLRATVVGETRMNPRFELDVELYPYFGKPTALGDTGWKLSRFTPIVELHLDNIPRRLDDLSTIGGYMQDARSTLGVLAKVVKPVGIRYIVAASNEKLIQALMHMVPGFRVVDYMPEGRRRDETIKSAITHDRSLGFHLRGKSFPIICIPKNDFVQSVEDAQRHVYRGRR